MSQRRKIASDPDLLPEYDFTGAVRGKYYERYRQGSNVVLLDPDVAEAFKEILPRSTMPYGSWFP